MNVYIWKYRALHDYSYTNYFNVTGGNPILVDKIKVPELLDIPIYEERLEKQDSAFEFTSGDFDVRLSLLSTSTSTLGKNIRDFLLPDGDRNFFYICVVELGDENNASSKRMGGRIDLSSIEANLTYSRNEYSIQFKVTSILKEIADMLTRTMLTSINSAYTLEIFISGCLNPVPMPTYLGNSTHIVWDDRIGFTPILMKEVYNDVLNLAGAGISKWQAFKELSLATGFVYRADFLYRGSLSTIDYPSFIVTTFWRNNSTTDKQLQIIGDIRKYSDWNTFKNYLIVTHRSNFLGTDNEYGGSLITNTGDIFCVDGYLGQVFEEMIFDKSTAVIVAIGPPSNPPLISSNSATIINLPTYSTNYRYIVNNDNQTDISNTSKVSFISLFVRTYHVGGNFQGTRWTYTHDFQQITAKTIGIEGKYWIAGIKRAAEFEIVFDETTNLNIYDTITLDGARYFCKAITDINLKEQTAKTQWIEV